MARRARAKSSTRPRGGAVSSFSTANRRLHPLPPLVSRYSLPPLYRTIANDHYGNRVLHDPRKRDLRLIDDRRRHYPGKARPAVSVGPRMDTRLKITPSFTKPLGLAAGVSFAVGGRVALCVRRKVRKEVIFASGRGGTKVRRPHRNEFSEVGC